MHLSTSCSSTLLTLLTLSLSLTTSLTTANPISPPTHHANQKHHQGNHQILRASPSVALKSHQTPHPPSLKPQASAELTRHIADIIASSASESLDPNTCPPNHASKQCCTSLSGLAEGILGESGVGSFLPYLKGVHVSSLVGLQCMAMEEDEENGNCTDEVMCCSGTASPNGEEVVSGSKSLFRSGCMPFDEAIAEKQEVIEKSIAQASQYAAEASASASASTSVSASASSSSVTPRPTASASASSSSVIPRPTAIEEPVIRW